MHFHCCEADSQSSSILPNLYIHGCTISLAPCLCMYAIQSSQMVFECQLGLAPKYLCDPILCLISATSLHPLGFSDWLSLYCPHVKTTMALSRSSACLLWNELPLQSSPPFALLVFPHFSLSHKSCLFSQGFSHWEHF